MNCGQDYAKKIFWHKLEYFFIYFTIFLRKVCWIATRVEIMLRRRSRSRSHTYRSVKVSEILSVFSQLTHAPMSHPRTSQNTSKFNFKIFDKIHFWKMWENILQLSHLGLNIKLLEDVPRQNINYDLFLRKCLRQNTRYIYVALKETWLSVNDSHF
jgi:hypothetical protein